MKINPGKTLTKAVSARFEEDRFAYYWLADNPDVYIELRKDVNITILFFD